MNVAMRIMMVGRALALSLASLSLSGCSLTLFAPPALQGPPPVATFTVEISGTPGVGFQGTLAPSNQSIEGQVPAEYTVVTAAAVGAAVTKAQVEGELTVRILQNGREVARRTTTAPYGMVTLLYTVH